MMGQHNRATSGQGDQLVRNVNLDGKRKLLDLGGGTGAIALRFVTQIPS